MKKGIGTNQTSIKDNPRAAPHTYSNWMLYMQREVITID